MKVSDSREGGANAYNAWQLPLRQPKTDPEKRE
jgi:hypothetical protein